MCFSIRQSWCTELWWQNTWESDSWSSRHPEPSTTKNSSSSRAEKWALTSMRTECKKCHKMRQTPDSANHLESSWTGSESTFMRKMLKFIQKWPWADAWACIQNRLRKRVHFHNEKVWNSSKSLWHRPASRGVVVDWLYYSKRIIVDEGADLSEFFRWFSSVKCVFLLHAQWTLPLFLCKTVTSQNGLLIFLGKETQSETNSWKSSRILRVNPNFFIFLSFLNHFSPLFFFFFSFIFHFFHFFDFSF